MKKRMFATGVLLAIAVVGAALFMKLLDGSGLGRVANAVMALPQSAQVETGSAQESDVAQITGAYSGDVKLGVTVGGVYSDTLATPPPPGAGTPTPPDLGSIDLSLQLTQTGSAVSGYVKLDKTLVFTVAHTLASGNASVDIGPYLSGSFDGANLKLQSEQVPMTVSGRQVLRQFRLTGASAKADGSQITGEYRETIWGYTSVPLTVIGNFSLQRPVFEDNAPISSNKPPVITADSAVTSMGQPVTINVLINDSDPNNNTLTIVSVSQPQFGTVTINGQTIIYTPNANFTGTDTFSYVVSDGQGGTTVGSVTITVNGPGGVTNRAPTAANDSATTAQGAAVTIDILANDADPDGDALNITIDGPPAHGTATVNNGKVIYTPNADFAGTDSFIYIVSDGKGATATATVTVTVTAVIQSEEKPVYLPLIWR